MSEFKLTNYKINILIPFVGLMWTTTSWLLSIFWGHGLFQGIGSTTLVILLLTIYENYLWNKPVLKVMSTAPNLIGKYIGKVSYNWQGQEQTKECKLEIKQTCSKIKIVTTFEKVGENPTESISTEAFFKTDTYGDQELYIYYRNNGSEKNGDTLNSHEGVNVLKIISDESGVTKLDGYYFTNRDPQTKGNLTAIKEIK